MSGKFHAKSTAMEVIAGHDLTGYESIVTGGASGIGTETVRALASAGARVIIATRNLKNAEEVAEQLRKDTGKTAIEAWQLELGSLKSVNAFVERYLATGRPLHILINNAGIMACPKGFTEDGIELQFGTNHIGHFALTLGLIPALKKGAAESGRNSRVVSVSSLAHVRSDVLFDDYNFDKTPYEPWMSYGQAKSANALFAVGLTKRYAADGIYANAVMPGGIMTGLQKHMKIEEQIARGWIDEHGTPNPDMKNVEQGASTSIYAAVAPELENVGGKYLDNCQIAPELINPMQTMAKINSLAPGAEKNKLLGSLIGYVARALDPERADKLWDLSLKILEEKKQQ